MVVGKNTNNFPLLLPQSPVPTLIKIPILPEHLIPKINQIYYHISTIILCHLSYAGKLFCLFANFN
ncbi:hypothetical protein H6F47_12675 [Sphaerospermopsis sp. FACHB-1094]|nr:hypothetical protein [Sphaerospermopsis sp. FACHB-1094]